MTIKLKKGAVIKLKAKTDVIGINRLKASGYEVVGEKLTTHKPAVPETQQIGQEVAEPKQSEVTAEYLPEVSTEPSRSNGSTASWLVYAQSLGLKVPTKAKRAQIIALVDSQGEDLL
jgi:hypothetical protein